jgi:hypothetical protein
MTTAPATVLLPSATDISRRRPVSEMDGAVTANRKPCRAGGVSGRCAVCSAARAHTS